MVLLVVPDTGVLFFNPSSQTVVLFIPSFQGPTWTEKALLAPNYNTNYFSLVGTDNHFSYSGYSGYSDVFSRISGEVTQMCFCVFMSFCTRMPKENIFTKTKATDAFYLPRKSEPRARNDSIRVDNIPFVRRNVVNSKCCGVMHSFHSV